MAPLSTVSRALARSSLRQLPSTTTAVRTVSSSPALRDAASSSTFESPFKGESKSSKVPDFSKYMSKGSGSKNALFSYFMVGTLGAISAAGAKSTIQGEFLSAGAGRLGVDGGSIGGGRQSGNGVGMRNRS